MNFDRTIFMDCKRPKFGEPLGGRIEIHVQTDLVGHSLLTDMGDEAINKIHGITSNMQKAIKEVLKTHVADVKDWEVNIL